MSAVSTSTCLVFHYLLFGDLDAIHRQAGTLASGQRRVTGLSLLTSGPGSSLMQVGTTSAGAVNGLEMYGVLLKSQS